MNIKPTPLPAFPYKAERRVKVSDDIEQVTPGDVPGMTLRDYFIANIGDDTRADYADHIKAGLVGRPRPTGHEDGWLAVLQFEAEFRAKWRVMRADAMMAAREAS